MIGSTTFAYDGSLRRSQNGAGVSFVYDGLNPVQEIVSGSVRANLVTGGLDEYFARTDSGGTSSFITDAIGSTLALADSTGAVQTQYTFDPFGNTASTGASSTNAFQYTGRENDGSGMYYYRARYYNATLQRFVSEDPLGFGGGEADLYVYTGDSPTNFIDPFGLDKKESKFKCANRISNEISIAGVIESGFDVNAHPIAAYALDSFLGNTFAGIASIPEDIRTNPFKTYGDIVGGGLSQGLSVVGDALIKFGVPAATSRGLFGIATDAVLGVTPLGLGKVGFDALVYAGSAIYCATK